MNLSALSLAVVATCPCRTIYPSTFWVAHQNRALDPGTGGGMLTVRQSGSAGFEGRDRPTILRSS